MSCFASVLLRFLRDGFSLTHAQKNGSSEKRVALLFSSFCISFLCALTSRGDAPAMPLYSVCAEADRHISDRAINALILILFIVVCLLYGLRTSDCLRILPALTINRMY